MTYTIDMLIDKIKEVGKSYDLDKIQAAYELAEKAHDGVFRSSGEPYITHPVAVAYILVEQFCMIQKKFGEDVAHLVDGVTKIGQVPLNTREEQQAENIRKILIAMSKDIRVIIIKLADRLHNMRTLQYMTPEKQKEKTKEGDFHYGRQDD